MQMLAHLKEIVLKWQIVRLNRIMGDTAEFYLHFKY